MLKAFALAAAQLADPRVLRLMAKSAVLVLLLLVALGALAAWAILALLPADWFSGEAGMALAVGIILLGGWLLWRIAALAVLQFYADEVVLAVEARHYPTAAARARQLGWREELANGLKGAGRALLVNLLALPVAAVLLVTGVGAPLVFFLVNAVLIGRELQDMVWLRHRHSPGERPPLGAIERLALGGAVTALLTIPFANLLAPFLGAAAATHLVHRKDTAFDAA